jgi:hypothetical protein
MTDEESEDGLFDDAADDFDGEGEPEEPDDDEPDDDDDDELVPVRVSLTPP